MRHLSISNESIEFQNGMFFKDLALAYAELGKLSMEKVRDEGPVIAKVIAHHTNMNIVVDIGDWHPCISIPHVNKNNPLVNSWQQGFVASSDGLRIIEQAGGAARGTVNLKLNKVSGIFADFQATIHMMDSMIKSTKYSPEECAAITLHEVGHLFTYFEFMSRTMTTNQALAGMSKALDGSSSVEEREMVFITVKKSLGLKDIDAKKLAQSTDKRIAEVVVLSNTARESKSELGHNVYDFNSWEYLSDQYAARNGAGRHLVTAMEKLYRGHISFRNSANYIALEALKVTLVIVGITAGIMAGGILGVVARYGLSIGVSLMAMDSSGDGTYDLPGARMKRVRSQIVENLKDQKLSKKDRLCLEEDLEVIDSVMKEVEDRRQWVGILWDSVSPSARRARTQELLQKELEDIAANELFTQAAKLRNLA